MSTVSCYLISGLLPQKQTDSNRQLFPLIITNQTTGRWSIQQLQKYQKNIKSIYYFFLFLFFFFFFFHFFSFFVLIGESLDLQSNAWMKSAGWRALGRHKQTQKCGIKVIDAARVLFNKWIATRRRSGGRDSIAHVKDQWIWSDRWMDRLRRDESCPCTGLRTNKSHYLPPWPTFSYFSRREQVFNKPIGHVLVI